MHRTDVPRTIHKHFDDLSVLVVCVILISLDNVRRIVGLK